MNPPIIQADHSAQGFDQKRLGQAGDADQEKMTAGEQRDKSFIDDAGLAKDDAADARANARQLLADLLDLVVNLIDRARARLRQVFDGHGSAPNIGKY